MSIPPAHEGFWAAAERQHPGLCRRDRFLEAFAFGDSETLADDLAALVLSGVKQATAGLAWAFEHESRPLPRPGDLSIVTDGRQRALGVIETTAVEVVPFDEVDADFARAEGEDDGTLASWRRHHTAFFGRECARIGREPGPKMPVVCERFRLIHPNPGSGWLVRPIRAAEHESARQLLATNGWGARITDPQRFGALLRGSTLSLVALDGVQVIGFLRALSDGLSNGYLSMVVVAESHRGRGVGSTLVRAAMDDRPEVTWVLRAGRDGVAGFYEKLGFQRSTVAMERPRQRA
jgi:uncharacterized protein YhfF/GNAT superfamily N-acetyltransferase